MFLSGLLLLPLFLLLPPLGLDDGARDVLHPLVTHRNALFGSAVLDLKQRLAQPRQELGSGLLMESKGFC